MDHMASKTATDLAYEAGRNVINEPPERRTVDACPFSEIEHPEERAIPVAVDARRGEQRAEDEEQSRRRAPDHPPEAAQEGRDEGDEEPRLRQVEHGRPARRGQGSASSRRSRPR